MDYAILSVILLFTLLLAYLLARLKISPVIAYLLGGLFASTYLNFDFNSSYFSILNFLALNLLAFEIGTSFDISRARELFRRAIGIALVELVLILLLSYYAGLYLLHLDPFISLFLVMASIDTSTSILYKILGRKTNKEDKNLLIAVASIEDIEVFFLYSIVVALNGSINFVRILSVIVEVILAGLIVYIFAKYFITGLSIFTPLSIEDESILILLPIALVFIFEYISQITEIPTTLTMILAGLAFSSISGSERVIKLTAPIREFALIFFFLSVGSYLKVTASIFTFILISLLVLIIKYFSFSIASWLTGTTFVKSFTNGFYMLPISEFGIIVSLEALQQGINVSVVYYVSVVVVLISSIIASIIATRVSIFQRIIGFVYSNSYFLRQLDSAIVWLNRNISKDLSPLSKSLIFRGFIKLFLYLLLPYILFPIINDFVKALVDPIGNILLEYSIYAGEIIIAMFLLMIFLSEGAKLYFTINNEILMRIIKMKSRLFKQFWLEFMAISSTFYILSISLIYIIFEIVPLLYNFPSNISLIPIILGLYLAYRRRNIKVNTIAFSRLNRNGITNKNIVKSSLKSIRKLRKNNFRYRIVKILLGK